MYERVFQLHSVTSNKVILKVNVNDTLTMAEFPFLKMTYDYITVTRGANHTLTVIQKDGTSFDFDWGKGGYTLISDNMKKLKQAVICFIEDYCSILLDWDTMSLPTKITIFYNDYFKQWSFHAETRHADVIYRSDWAEDMFDMDTEVRRFFPDLDIKDWRQSIAVTGITIWEAVL